MRPSPAFVPRLLSSFAGVLLILGLASHAGGQSSDPAPFRGTGRFEIRYHETGQEWKGTLRFGLRDNRRLVRIEFPDGTAYGFEVEYNANLHQLGAREYTRTSADLMSPKPPPIHQMLYEGMGDAWLGRVLSLDPMHHGLSAPTTIANIRNCVESLHCEVEEGPNGMVRYLRTREVGPLGNEAGEIIGTVVSHMELVTQDGFLTLLSVSQENLPGDGPFPTRVTERAAPFPGYPILATHTRRTEYHIFDPARDGQVRTQYDVWVDSVEPWPEAVSLADFRSNLFAGLVDRPRGREVTAQQMFGLPRDLGAEMRRQQIAIAAGGLLILALALGLGRFRRSKAA